MTLVKYHRHSAAFNESHARSTKFCKKKSYTEFHENPTYSLVASVKSQMGDRTNVGSTQAFSFYFIQNAQNT